MIKRWFSNIKTLIINIYSLIVASTLNTVLPFGRKSNWIFAGNITYQHISRMILAGFLIMIPFVLTYMFAKFLVDIIDGVLAPYISLFFGGKRIYGLGVLALMIVVYIVGLLSTRYFGQKIGDAIQNFVLRMPVVGSLYSSARRLIESLAGTKDDDSTGFKRVVMIEHPRRGMWCIGFLTSIIQVSKSQKMATVYIPTAPTPNSGFVVMVPYNEINDTDLSVQEAMSMVLSGGIIAPESFNTKTITSKEIESIDSEILKN
tara:strand:- start:5902 stop:6681 length:780 start_codon:yes stop_codon:yes gene_type:complete